MEDPYYQNAIDITGDASLPFKFRWGGAEDSDGLAMDIHFDGNPEFCEINFDEDISLMMELNGRWFYKAPGVKCIDFMSAFYKNPIEGSKKLTLKLFAPPASGENDPSQGADWQTNYYYTLKKLPKIRIEYKPVVEDLDRKQ